MADKNLNVPAIELFGITKSFAGTKANDGIGLKVMPGTVHALLGENGAGKSTLMKILYGMYLPDGGRIEVKGSEVKIRSPQDSAALGIGMIHQHFTLVPVHTVLENVLLTLDDYRPARTARRLEELGCRYGLEVDPGATIRDLPVGVQQRVEILKALYRQSDVLIMDEPTAVLTPQEVERLFDFIREFRAAGNTVVFISHKMNEVLEIADHVTVLKAGRVAGNLPREEATEQELVRLMVGHSIVPPIVSGEPSSQVVLDVGKLCVRNDRGFPSVEDVSFSVRAGEIFAIAGVSGNGQEELAEALCGLRPAAGDLRIDGAPLIGRPARFYKEAGVGYIPEDRHRFGLVLDMSVEENLMLKSSDSPPFCVGGTIDRKELRERAITAMEDYSIKAPSAWSPAEVLSGGNQQKIVIAREVEIGRRFLLAFQPTRGLDIGASDYVHRVLLRCRAEGRGILLISAELTEILALADRIGVMYRGRLAGILERGVDVETIGRLMAGGEAA